MYQEEEDGSQFTFVDKLRVTGDSNYMHIFCFVIACIFVDLLVSLFISAVIEGRNLAAQDKRGTVGFAWFLLLIPLGTFFPSSPDPLLSHRFGRSFC